MKFKTAVIVALAFLCISAQAALPSYGSAAEPDSPEYRHALGLYDKGMFAEAMLRFRQIADRSSDGNARGYYVLCATHLRVPGYETLISGFVSDCQSSDLIPRIRYRFALNLFDDRDFSGASVQFEQLSRHDLYRSQVPEFLFKRAYCDFEQRNFDRALLRFKDLALRAHSDYTAPAQYAIGYICYEKENFAEAAEWLEKARKDSRFTEISDFYLVECRFMLKEYETVRKTGPGIMEKVSEDKRPYIARFISESCLVLGDTETARRYFEISRKSLSPQSRSDFFYAGSVLYAVKDYRGAIENFSLMTDRSDSLGQIADYHLGYSYIRTGNKVAAMDAFRDAARTAFDPAITEDAFFNYAKLAFDLNTDSSVFYDYLKAYSEKGKSEQIYSYIALAALYNRDYAAAIEAYDQIDELDGDMVSNYRKANYLRANELISAGSYRAAVDCLRAAAYYSDRRSYFYQMSRYWLAEAYYNSSQYDNALQVLADLYNTSALYGKKESALIPLNMAYCHLKQDDYDNAVRWFGSYLETGDTTYRKDALLRTGDCRFVQQRYSEAISAYDRVLADYFDADDIYPYYQAALSYGLAGNASAKIRLLSNVEKASPSSAFYPEAMYEYGRSLVAAGNPDRAVRCFNTLISDVRDSIFIARSYIELGMIYRNRSENDKALGYYRKVVEDLPLSEYADAALLAIESIYKSQNEPDEYLAYIESIGRSSLKTDEEKEMMIYNAAEQIFLSGNYTKALASLASYMDRYPDGRMMPDAWYYTAECYRMSGQPETACDYYRKVMDADGGSFREQAELNFAELSYSMQKYADAFNAYASLYVTAGNAGFRFTALTGLMRSAYRARMYDEAIRYSGLLARDSGTDPDLLREAEYVNAKSLLATSRRDEAMAVLTRLAETPSTAEGAEAAFLLIQDSYDRGVFDEVESRVYAFSDSKTTRTYWLAKAFIVLGDAFVEMDNLDQAKATFESVAYGYQPESGTDDVLPSVRMRLEKLSELMKTVNVE